MLIPIQRTLLWQLGIMHLISKGKAEWKLNEDHIANSKKWTGQTRMGAMTTYRNLGA